MGAPTLPQIGIKLNQSMDQTGTSTVQIIPKWIFIRNLLSSQINRRIRPTCQIWPRWGRGRQERQVPLEHLLSPACRSHRMLLVGSHNKWQIMEEYWPQEQREKRSGASAFTQIWYLRSIRRNIQDKISSTKVWYPIFSQEWLKIQISMTPILIRILKRAFTDDSREIKETKTKLASWTPEETSDTKVNQP